MKRAMYQGRYCWGKVLQVAIDLPSPGDWGWTDPQCCKPLWSTLPEASKSSRELLHCGCKKGFSGRCKCRKAALKSLLYAYVVESVAKKVRTRHFTHCQCFRTISPKRFLQFLISPNVNVLQAKCIFLRIPLVKLKKCANFIFKYPKIQNFSQMSPLLKLITLQWSTPLPILTLLRKNAR